MPTIKRTTGTRRKQESKLLADIRLYLGERDDVLAVRINTGLFRAMHSTGVVRSAPNGHPDLVACHRLQVNVSRVVNADGFTPHTRERQITIGRYVAIETKAPKGVLSEDQKNFKAAVEAAGGLYIVARSLDDVIQALDAPII